LGRSIDRASRSRHSKFKPAVLGEIQAAGDTPCCVAENPSEDSASTGAQDIHQAVYHRTHVGAALTAARPRRRNEWRNNRPLLVREVAWASQMITIVSRSFETQEPLAKLQWCDEFSTGMSGKRGVRGVLG
jgi:hypothetical protein